MISLIEARNYCCLKYKSQPLSEFNVLVGPNASGKTTFLDVICFLSEIVSDGSKGLESAINTRTSNFYDLLWKKTGNSFEMAIEAVIPKPISEKLEERFDRVRYEVSIGMNEHSEISILAERGILKQAKEIPKKQPILFPENISESHSILTARILQHSRTIFKKIQGGNDNYYSEIDRKGGWRPAFKLGPRKSTLANLPEDEKIFPVATWLKELLKNNIQKFVLNSQLIRKASPPGQIRHFKPDGSNLPWVAERLREKDNNRFQEWIAHLQTALPDIENILIKEREDDKHRYLVIKYRGGLEVPSWMVSDGTLRLLALTIPAYLTDFQGIYLIEEPENGIHPRAVGTVIDSLSSVYNAQILLATHSPVILSTISPDKVLCFAKDEQGATDIVLGSDHPALRDWKGEENLGVLYASGVLG
jgi:predicted ATPase